jgi:hypothetical protein
VLRIDVSDQGSGGSGGIRPGHGLDIAVRAPATQAGIQVLFDSGPHGTSVRLRWEASDDDPTVNPDRALASAAFRVVTWIALIAATVTALTWSAASGSVVALLLLIAVIGLGWAAARGAIEIPVRWPIGTGLLVAAVIVIVLPAQGSPTCAAFGLGWWGADGAIAVLIVLLALTRGWAWTVAGLVALAGGIAVMAYAPTAVPPDCGRVPLALMPLELGFFAMIVIARSALLRLWQAAAANTAALNQRRLSADVAAERARAADRRVDAAVDAVIPLLNGIASGDVDPREECVTSQCAQLEETLRTLLRIGPEPSGVGDLLADLVIRALGQGNTIRLTALPSQALAYPGWLPVRLASIVDALPIGTTVTIAVIADRELVSMMMTADCHIPDDPRTAQRPGSVTFVHLAEQTLIEIRWPR